MRCEEIIDSLNEYQKEAVLDESDACIVNANVGSGKTTVLIAKILYLHYIYYYHMNQQRHVCVYTSQVYVRTWSNYSISKLSIDSISFK